PVPPAIQRQVAGRLTTNAATAQALYYLTVEVDSKKVTALCDTGASVSLITIKEVRRLKAEVKPLRNKDEQALFTADGKKVRKVRKVTKRKKGVKVLLRRLQIAAGSTRKLQ